jgi:hypothetical protein
MNRSGKLNSKRRISEDASHSPSFRLVKVIQALTSKKIEVIGVTSARGWGEAPPIVFNIFFVTELNNGKFKKRKMKNLRFMRPIFSPFKFDSFVK